MSNQKHKGWINQRLILPILLPLLSLVFTFIVVQSLTASELGGVVDLAESTKSVDQAEASAGSELAYAVVLSNTSVISVTDVFVTDTLPASLTYVPVSLTVSPDLGQYSASNGVITWTGTISPDSEILIQFSAALTDTLIAGSYVTNTAQIAVLGNVITREAGTLIVADVTTSTLYLPLVFKPVPAPTLASSRPTNANSWTVSWTTDVQNITKYEIQEAQDPTFSTFTATELTETTQQVTKQASFNNDYYYRVRSYIGSQASNWSNVVHVMGNYRDDFNDPASHWSPVRRTTYLEETEARYGTGSEAGNLIVIVGDRWDWLIASPLQEAPPVPYVIEYRARVHDASNLVSGGMVFGGDWNGEPCPEFGNIYQTDNCFNHFYNFNFIFYGPLKLLHEQVNELIWCPTCGGSPIKRIGPTQEIDPVLANGPSLNWHIYRYEVSGDGTRFYLDGSLKGYFADTTWINEPYFGVFASTDEYKPSIWFYDYFTVSYLD